MPAPSVSQLIDRLAPIPMQQLSATQVCEGSVNVKVPKLPIVMLAEAWVFCTVALAQGATVAVSACAVIRKASSEKACPAKLPLAVE